MSDNNIDNSIHQLREITVQQNVILSLQSTLAIQKATIADIRTSINHMIHSVSEIATKLGFEITLPPPLPLSPAPPTPLSCTVVHSAIAPSSPASPAPPPTAAVAAPLLHFPSFSVPPLPNSSAFSITQPSFSYSDNDDNLFLFNGNKPPLALTSNLTNNLPKPLSVIDCSSTLLHSSTFCIAYQDILGAHSEVATSETYSICKAIIGSKHKLQCEKKVYIFDPGGTLYIDNIFDLEDKVDFKGSVMIRYWNGIDAPAASRPRHITHRPARYLGFQAAN